MKPSSPGPASTSTASTGQAPAAARPAPTLEAYALARLGWLYYSRERFEEAERLFAGLVTLFPTDAYGWYGLGLVARRRRDLQGAATRLQHALKLDAGMDEARLALAELLLEHNHAREARELLAALVAAGDRRAKVLLERW